MPRPAKNPDDPATAGDATTGVHGEKRGSATGPLTEPVHQTATYVAERTSDFDDFYDGRAEGFIYTRYANRTSSQAAEKIARLEGTERALLTASGMSAISMATMALTKAGGRLISVEDTYGGTERLFREVLPRFGIRVEKFPTTDAKALEALLEEGPADAVYLESPTNPTLRLADIEACVAAARRHGVPTIIDNTFASPVNQKPHAMGVDVVVHSATKYLAGHGDVIAGAVAADRDLFQRILTLAKYVGPTLDPHAAFLVDRGLKTLALRVRHINANAQAVAEWLERHPSVQRVHYPGLASHPQHALAKRQMPGGFGGVLAFDLPSKEAAYRFADSLRIVKNAASLGTVESLVSLPIVQSHRYMTDEARARSGIVPGTVRLAVGVEDTEDLVADLEQALAKAVR